MFYRQTWLQIDCDAITHNIKAVAYRSNKAIIGVIKANGYGLQDVYLAKLLLSRGVEMLAVSSLDEALNLRKHQIKAEILVLGYCEPSDIKVAISNNIILTVVSYDWVKAITTQDCKGLRVHIKVDTGMNRLGVNSIEDFQTSMAMLKKMGIKIEGIYTHYACSDEADNQTTQQQFNHFQQYLKAIDHQFKWIHASNSDAAIHFQENVTNAVRAGIALLGYANFDEDLVPALGLYSKISNIKYVEPGNRISYGGTYTTTLTEMIATIPIGYADGFIRKNQDREVYCNGTFGTLVGRICMDQCMVRLSSPAQAGDIIEIFGPHMPLKTMAAQLDTIVYEIITLISDRVARVYTIKGKVIHTINPRIH